MDQRKESKILKVCVELTFGFGFGAEHWGPHCGHSMNWAVPSDGVIETGLDIVVAPKSSCDFFVESHLGTSACLRMSSGIWTPEDKALLLYIFRAL